MGKTSESIKIRAMSAADVAPIIKIENNTFFDAWNESMWLDELNNSITHYIVMEENGAIVGYAGFWLVAGEAQVTRVAIDKNERGRGLGMVLTANMINKAWEFDAKAITLEVRESNVVAQKVYLTCGFVIDGIRPNYYEDNKENAVIMWLYKEEQGV